MKKQRAPRCPNGYRSRTYRTDPAIHAEIQRLAEVHKKPGGAGQILTELGIKYIKEQTGKTFKDGFKDFYAEKQTTDEEHQARLKELENEALKPKGRGNERSQEKILFKNV